MATAWRRVKCYGFIFFIFLKNIVKIFVLSNIMAWPGRYYVFFYCATTVQASRVYTYQRHVLYFQMSVSK